MHTGTSLNFLCALFSLLLCSSAFALQSGDFTYTTDNTTVTITGYTGPGGDVVIPGTIDGMAVAAIGHNAFCFNSAVSSVIIPATVTQIRDTLNYIPEEYCDSLWLYMTYYGSFSYCSNLTALYFMGNSPTVLSEPAPAGSCYQTWTTFLQVPCTVYYREGATGFGSTWEGRPTALWDPDATTTTIRGDNSTTTTTEGDNSTTTTIDDNATTTVPATTTAPVTTTTTVAPTTTTTTALVWGDFTYSVSASDNVTITGYIGPGGDVAIPNTIDGMPVVGIGHSAFANQTAVATITIPDGVTSIRDYAFYGCTGLTNITIPGNISSLGNNVFQNCTDLSSVAIMDGVTSIGSYAFYGCYSLTSITIPNSVLSIEANAFSQCTGLTSINIPDSVTSIGGGAFSQCTGLTNIAMPNSLTSISAAAFSSCTSLTSINIPASITSIGFRAFYNCSNLTAAYFYDDAPTMEDSVFYGCASDFTVYYLAGAAGFTNPWYGYPTVMLGSFPTTTIPATTTISVSTTTTTAPLAWGDFTYSVSASDNVTITGYTGPGGDLEIPGTIDGMPVVGIGDSAFENKTGITSATIPDSVIHIGFSAFAGCTGLITVHIGSGVANIKNSSMYYWNRESYLFEGCTGLINVSADASNPNYTSLDGVLYSKDRANLVIYPCGRPGAFTIPDGVTYIERFAFYGCTGLTGLTIPASVTKINGSGICEEMGYRTEIHGSFYDCPLLTAAYFKGTAPSVGFSCVFGGEADTVFTDAASSFTVYYAAGATGFTNPWYSHPTAAGDPEAATTTIPGDNSTTTVPALTTTTVPVTTSAPATSTVAPPVTTTVPGDNSTTTVPALTTTTIGPGATTTTTVAETTTTSVPDNDTCRLRVVPSQVKTMLAGSPQTLELSGRMSAQDLDLKAILSLLRMAGYAMPLKFVVLIADTKDALTCGDLPLWDSPSIRTIAGMPVGRKAMLALVFIDPFSAEEGFYEVSVCDCTGMVELREP